METFFSTIFGLIMLLLLHIWDLLSDRWFWIIVIGYFFLVQPITKHFSEQDSRLARVERMLKELTGHIQ